MPKKDIHPKQHKMFIQLNDGTKIEIFTTYGKEGEIFKLDIDPTNHPAWQDGKVSYINVNDERINKFNKKFGNFDFGVKKTEEESSS